MYKNINSTKPQRNCVILHAGQAGAPKETITHLPIPTPSYPGYSSQGGSLRASMPRSCTPSHALPADSCTPTRAWGQTRPRPHSRLRHPPVPIRRYWSRMKRSRACNRMATMQLHVQSSHDQSGWLRCAQTSVRKTLGSQRPILRRYTCKGGQSCQLSTRRGWVEMDSMRDAMRGRHVL